MDVMNKFTWTTEVLWRKRDGMATLSKGESLSHSLKEKEPQPLPGQAFSGFLIADIKGGFQPLCSGLLQVITFYR